MWLLVLWVGVAVLAATAIIALRATHDGAIDGAPAPGALILVVGVLALVLGVAATVGGWGMRWHGTHVGGAYHDLTVPTLGLVLTVEPGRSSVTGVDGLPPGSHPFECAVPGHAAAGMRGTLQVVGDDAGPRGSPLGPA